MKSLLFIWGAVAITGIGSVGYLDTQINSLVVERANQQPTIELVDTTGMQPFGPHEEDYQTNTLTMQPAVQGQSTVSPENQVFLGTDLQGSDYKVQ